MKKDRIDRIIGEHPDIVSARETLRAIQRLPSGTRPPAVLIEGERGTGKSNVVSYLHYQGPRRYTGLADSYFMDMEEGAMDEMLFGSAGGRPGYLSVMRKGGMFFQDIDRFPERLQPKLLQVIKGAATDEGAGVEPEGVWVIAYTAVDLGLMVSRGRFSRPLYEALRGISIRLPPLRDRGFDVIRLAEYFIARRCFRWERPGNVQELSVVLNRAVDVVKGYHITAAGLGIPATRGNVGM